MNATNSFVGTNISDAKEFTRHLTTLLRNEHAAMVEFLFALAELDSRRLWAEMGYASVFAYLVRELRLSKSAAFYRNTAAALVQRYPEIADALADGRLCMTSVAEVAKVITPENVRDVLPRFYGLSSREAKEVVAELIPQPSPPRREVVTVLPIAAPTSPGRQAEVTPVSAPELVLADGQSQPGSARASGPESVEAASAQAPRLQPSEVVQPLTATLRRVHYTVTKKWVEKLDAAKAVLSHAIPSGSAEAVLEAALDALLEREAKRRGLAVKKPRARPDAQAEATERAQEAARSEPVERTDSASVPTRQSQHRKVIPAHVRREVVQRDDGRCQARLHDGSVCGSRMRVQFDHVTPIALGGPSTVDNVRVLCERHNQLAARAVFGEAGMELFSRRHP